MSVWQDATNALGVLTQQITILTSNVQDLTVQNSALIAKIQALEAQLALQTPMGPTQAQLDTFVTSLVNELGAVENAANTIEAIAKAPLP
jgi:hypothetical protein